jgi:hypothetical protein
MPHTSKPPTAAAMLRALRAVSNRARVPDVQRFFRTGAGQYGEGDRFIGATVPAVRTLCRQFKTASLESIDSLLQSPIHEARLLALLLLVQAFRATDERGQRRIYTVQFRKGVDTFVHEVMLPLLR